MADKAIQLSVKVKTDTGQLEVLGAKFSDIGKKAEQAKSSFSKLGGEAKSLLTSFLPFATAGGIVAFFVNAVRSAEAHSESLRRLKGNLEAVGVSFDQNKAQIIAWSEAIQASTRFDNDVALATLERFIKVTGNLSQAQRASSLAMDISVQTGKNLGEVESLLVNLINKNTRGVMEANREFGALTGHATSAQQAIDNLARATEGAAVQERSLTKDVGQAKAGFGDLSREVGESLLPTVSFVTHAFLSLVKTVQSLGSMLGGVFAAMLDGFKGMSAAIMAASTGHFTRARVIALATSKEIAEDFKKTNDDLNGIWEKQSEKQIQEAMKGGAGRVQVNQAMNEQELADRRDQAAKIEQIENDLNQKMAALGEDSFAKKRAMLNAEEKAERDKIMREVKDKEAQKKLLEKMDQVYTKRGQELARLDSKFKVTTAIEVADLSIQALSTLNAMGELKSKNDVRRAILLLALEKAIAIARLWSAEAGKGIAGVAIASAGTALIAAQFAAQSHAIKEAQKQSEAGRQEFTVSTPLLGGSELETSYGGGGGSSGGSSSFGGGSLAPAVGGGSGTTVTNVGGVVVNFHADHVDLSEIEAVASRLAEYVRSGVAEGIALAVTIRNVGDKNALRAV
jgi:hypothetical protein